MTRGLVWAIADQEYKTAEEKIFAYRTALKIIDNVCYNSYYAYLDSYFSAYFLRCICRLRAQNDDFGESIYDDIKAMINSCKRVDEQKIGKHYFVGNFFVDSVYYHHDLNDTEMRWARELLDDQIFDSIRNSIKFSELMNDV